MRKNFRGLSKAARAFKCLIAKQENLLLKKRKLELEALLLEQKLCFIPVQSQSICAIEVFAYYMDLNALTLLY